MYKNKDIYESLDNVQDKIFDCLEIIRSIKHNQFIEKELIYFEAIFLCLLDNVGDVIESVINYENR